MFEDSLIESTGRIKTKSKYYTIVGLILNGSDTHDNDLAPVDLSRSTA